MKLKFRMSIYEGEIPMSNDLSQYNNALRYVFSEACGGTGKPADWTASEWTVNTKGDQVCDFKNKEANIVVHVTDGGEDDGGRKFSAEGELRSGGGDVQANMSIPSNWKNLKI